MRMLEKSIWALAIAGATVFAACGGDTTTNPPLPPPTPAATIQAAGNGVIRLHPSQDARFQVALEMPLRVTESTGGTADWTFARYSVIRGGAEIERNEVGSDVLGQRGFSRINPRSNVTPTLVFRQNALDFDSLTIALGFTDIKDGRQFTVDVPFSSFAGVDISIIPALVPSDNAQP